MKKSILLLIALLPGLIACEKFLDEKPAQSIASDDAIRDKQGVERAITGSYDVLQFYGSYGMDIILVAGLAADNLLWSGTSFGLGQIQAHTIPADNGYIEEMWADPYDGINRVNNVLAKLPSIEMTEPERSAYAGQCYFLRGLFHFDLMRHFGKIPIKTTPTSSPAPQEVNVSRDPVEDVYKQVISDLRAAELGLPASAVQGRAESFSATALLAKVYLYRYHATGNSVYADSAIIKSTEVIESGVFSLVDDYGALFEPGANSEGIFEVVYNSQDRNFKAQWFFPRSLAGRYEVTPTAGLIAAFPEGDARREVSIAYDVENKPYGYKYRDISSGTDRDYVIRLAEMYLVRAEANTGKGGDISAILADVNRVRNRAGLEDAAASTHDELRLLIENENRLEFAFEGHRWHDLVRTGRAIAVLGIQPYQVLFPIPLSEILANPAMDQNTGY